jgi:hypothetical protein
LTRQTGEPVIWRWIGCVFALILITVGGSVVLSRATATDDPRCLTLTDSIGDTGLLDLRTGVALDIKTIPGRLQQYSVEAGANLHQKGLSPDQKYFAYSAFDNAANRFQLFLKRTDRPGFAPGSVIQASVGKFGSSTTNDPPDFAWSADSRSLAYWWQTADQRFFLGVADTAGHVQHVQPIPVKNPGRSSVILHGWSADGSYFALTVTDTQTNVDHLLLWAASDLRLIQTLQFMPRRCLYYPCLVT